MGLTLSSGAEMKRSRWRQQNQGEMMSKDEVFVRSDQSGVTEISPSGDSRLLQGDSAASVTSVFENVPTV